MKTSVTAPTKKTAARIVDLLSHGLVSGLGRPKPGEMCVEAAVCFALGLPHGDKPPCVGEAVRSFKIRLNDCAWSSNDARAKGMKKLAVAQLGSDVLDQMKFGKMCYLRGVQQLMPIIFRKAAEDLKREDKSAFVKIADECAAVRNFSEAENVAKSASASAYPYPSAYAYAYAYAYPSAYDYDSAYPYPSAYAYAYAYAYPSAYDYDYAYPSASASASAPAYAYAYAWFKKNLGDEFLIATAEMGLGVLIEMKSPGCKWLSLCDEHIPV